ncbi:hypothetical protein MICAE_2230001 [Microcystis aeruginosa PCC 9806]|uniref:Uncharacterized protein n=1 Tax=Microcystis aeruginosa PCC 9806 TaxID=1160282 RepID=I4GVW2_MICAE|nr:hypothetical protein MICAE_2230001 [Microcystis aeruginosa PCC 9806]
MKELIKNRVSFHAFILQGDRTFYVSHFYFLTFGRSEQVLGQPISKENMVLRYLVWFDRGA